MPQVISFTNCAEMLAKGSFNPLPWAIDLVGDKKSFWEHTINAVRNGWNTGAIDDDGSWLYVAGIVPQRWLHGHCIEAEVWSVPCVDFSEDFHLRRFMLRHARTIDRFQREKHIPRLTAFVMFGNPWGFPTAAAVNLLEHLGFEYEGLCEQWWRGETAIRMARISTNFQQPADFN